MGKGIFYAYGIALRRTTIGFIPGLLKSGVGDHGVGRAVGNHERLVVGSPPGLGDYHCSIGLQLLRRLDAGHFGPQAPSDLRSRHRASPNIAKPQPS